MWLVLFFMAKELPFFKFEPNAWDAGNIQICSRESKGLFIDICSLYWSRTGELPYALALQKLCNGNKDALQELIDNEIIGLIEGQICIEFLDEQLSEFNQTSEKRRFAANKRWKNASAMQVQSKSNAIRGDKRREEEKIYGDKSDNFFIIRKKYLGDQTIRIYDLKVWFSHTGQLVSLVASGHSDFDGFMKSKPAAIFEDANHLYNSFIQHNKKEQPKKVNRGKLQ